MKKMLTAVMAFSLLAGSAFAADLPKRKTPPPVAPIVTVNPNAITGFYLGAGAGYAFNNEFYNGNVRGGYDFGYVRLEGAYDYYGKEGATANHALTANALLEYSFANFTPYFLAGTGVLFNTNGFDQRVAVYNVGGGLRYNVTENIELDARYRFLNTIEAIGSKGEHITTIGVNYKF